MNKRSVKARPTKPRRNAVGNKVIARQASGQPQAVAAAKVAVVSVVQQITTRSAVLRAHKFRVGQAVLFTSSPITRPGASGSYKVVRLLPSDGEDYQYRIKSSDEAFERVAKESQLELEY